MPAKLPPYGPGALYLNIASYPELGLFRRFGSYWAKKLHDDTCLFLDSVEKVNLEIQALPDVGEDNILDCPLRIMKQRYSKDVYPDLYEAWDEYDQALLQHGKTLCLSQQIMNFPNQDPFYTKHLTEEFKPPVYKSIFEQGPSSEDTSVTDIFVPTGEEAQTYMNLTKNADSCAWTSPPRTDLLTMHFIRSGKWIEQHILKRLRRYRPFRSRASSTIQADATQTDVRHDRIVNIMDILTCLMASGLLTASVLALTWLESLRVRVAVVGVFGTLFALLVKLLGGDIGRAQIFTATAGYFAVAVVFVASATVDCACPQVG